ncbi:beta-glucosidase BglX [Ancylomarina sp. 16SWW S1-10-2]|uniref:beta-glucosidase BglX n=1 Tax=Ancylomarina sp. 16SWW S1-10-2 TaxID=2499681 RepID=UPI0012AEA0F4|nr:beta-glucosidase BglX [Ancylomarina sp. 16SWW S1-10-2]MRT92027.1 beta-glucosidase BglX [Ancylomarina sp. 16SWW S1-10-2]
MNRTLLLFIVFVQLSFGVSFAQNNSAKAQQIESILSKLSIEEKAGQLNLIPITGEPTEKHLQMIRDGKVGSIIKSNGAAQNFKLQKIALEESKSGLPILFQEDVIHGYKTIAPIPLAEAASWDLEAIRKSAAVAAREAAAAGIQLTYAPMVDVCRDPRWGRIIEAAGEDPYLGSLVAAARVQGFQNSGENANQNILACVKHFAGYGASLAGRDYNIQDVSERELREVYLPPFQAAIDAGVASLMCAYTAYDGLPVTASKFLMQDVLRGEMGFKGLTMTDWQTIPNMVKIGVAENDTIATLMSMDAGIDMDMSSWKYVQLIPYLVKTGKITEKQVDDAVRQVLILKQKAGLLDDALALFNEKRQDKELLSKKNFADTKDIALKSMVLLKNKEQILPIKKTVKNIAVVGPFAKVKRDLLGWWACKGNPDDVISIYEGLEKEFGKDVNLTYAKGCEIDSFKRVGAHLIPEAVKVAQKADLVIVVLGEEYWMSGEGGGTASLHLPSYQEKLLAELAKTSKPIVSVIATGRPYILTQVADNSDAVLQAWMPGTVGGEAVAEVLSGKFNPCGKLPVTFPYHEGQVPIFHSYKKTSHTFNSGPKDNRYSTTYRDVQNAPLYPFGFGLSYTSFDYSAIELNSSEMTQEGSLKASVKITNTGKVAGREIVQLYLRDKFASVIRPMKELKDFALLDLEEGESKTVTFEITADKLSFIGRDYKTIVEAGEFTLFIGPNSSDLKETTFRLK